MSGMDANLADLVGAVADAVPDRCALVCDGDRLSCRQLMDRASQLAQHLIAARLRPDETAGLHMLNSGGVRGVAAGVHARPPGPGQHQLPVHRKRARAPVHRGEACRAGGRC